MRPRLVRAVATLAFATVLVSPCAATDVPSVRVGAVELPPKKDGGRDLRHAMGRDAEALVGSALEDGLRATSLVEVASGEEADLVLAIRIEKARTRPDDRTDLSGGTSLIDVRATVTWEWRQGADVVHSGRLERQRLHEHPGRIDTRGLTLAWQELLAEVGAGIVLESGASGAFRLIDDSPSRTPGNAGSTGPVSGPKGGG